MCNCCDPDYEAMVAKYEAEKAELLAQNEALESALSESLRCYKKLSDENFQLVVTNTHLMKRAYYAPK